MPRLDAMDVTACTCANLRKAARIVTQTYDAALQPTGLKATQFSLLATIERTGELPLSRLADVLVMERTTLTRNLRPLERSGYVEIEPDTDRRVRRIRLTAAGAEVLAQAQPYWQRVQAKVVESLGPQRWSGMVEDLRATVSSAQGG